MQYTYRTQYTYVWNETDSIEMVTQLRVVKGNQMGKFGKIFWNKRK